MASCREMDGHAFWSRTNRRTDGAYLTMSVHFKLTAKRSKGAGKADCVVSAVHLPLLLSVKMEILSLPSPPLPSPSIHPSPWVSCSSGNHCYSGSVWFLKVVTYLEYHPFKNMYEACLISIRNLVIKCLSVGP